MLRARTKQKKKQKRNKRKQERRAIKGGMGKKMNKSQYADSASKQKQRLSPPDSRCDSRKGSNSSVEIKRNVAHLRQHQTKRKEGEKR